LAPEPIVTRDAILPDPQLDQHRTVVGELIPHGFVSLAVRDLTKGAAIDPGHDPPVDDEVVDELGEPVVPAADGHVLREHHEIRVGGLAVVEVAPDLIIRPD
jgi:hypothetical protein